MIVMNQILEQEAQASANGNGGGLGAPPPPDRNRRRPDRGGPPWSLIIGTVIGVSFFYLILFLVHRLRRDPHGAQ
jgi:hypothetical protein